MSRGTFLSGAAVRREPIARFVLKFDVDPGTGCWVWTASRKPNGYAQFNDGAHVGMVHAHRWAFEHFVGPIPEGLDLDHLCRVRHCVNPDHLEPCTRRENLLRGDTLAARYARRTHCGKGHVLAGENLRRLRDGSRQCITCRREYRADRRAKGFSA